MVVAVFVISLRVCLLIVLFIHILLLDVCYVVLGLIGFVYSSYCFGCVYCLRV